LRVDSPLHPNILLITLSSREEKVKKEGNFRSVDLSGKWTTMVPASRVWIPYNQKSNIFDAPSILPFFFVVE
jgi:hypothetical protein